MCALPLVHGVCDSLSPVPQWQACLAPSYCLVDRFRPDAVGSKWWWAAPALAARTPPVSGGQPVGEEAFCQGQMAGGEAEALLEPAPRSQLDRLLAGLDELSGTLPDLTASSWTPARPASSQAAEQRGTGGRAVQCSAGAGRGVQGGSQSAGGAVRAAPVQQGVSAVQGCGAGEQGGQVVMGRQGRPGGPGSLAARSYEEDVDYALEKDGERRRGGEEGAPYHTRYDSKPFSYIR